MDPQTLYRIGSPALGGPPLLDLRYRVVSLSVGTDVTTVPVLVLADFSTVEAWIAHAPVIPRLPDPGLVRIARWCADRWARLIAWWSVEQWR